MDSYKITHQTWNKVALVYQENFANIDLYDDTYNTFCNLVDKRDALIFEIGCGPGNVTKYLLNKRPDFKIEAIDVSPNMIQLAIKNNPTSNFKVMDCREIEKVKKTFDAIMCGFCMPYLSKDDCTKLITDCSKLLINGGVLYFSTIEGDYSKSGFETSCNNDDKMYIYYHSIDFLGAALKQNNFEKIELKKKDFQRKDGTIVTTVIFIARKK